MSDDSSFEDFTGKIQRDPPRTSPGIEEALVEERVAENPLDEGEREATPAERAWYQKVAQASNFYGRKYFEAFRGLMASLIAYCLLPKVDADRSVSWNDDMALSCVSAAMLLLVILGAHWVWKQYTLPRQVGKTAESGAFLITEDRGRTHYWIGCLRLLVPKALADTLRPGQIYRCEGFSTSVEGNSDSILIPVSLGDWKLSPQDHAPVPERALGWLVFTLFQFGWPCVFVAKGWLGYSYDGGILAFAVKLVFWAGLMFWAGALAFFGGSLIRNSAHPIRWAVRLGYLGLVLAGVFGQDFLVSRSGTQGIASVARVHYSYLKDYYLKGKHTSEVVVDSVYLDYAGIRAPLPWGYQKPEAYATTPVVYLPQKPEAMLPGRGMDPWLLFRGVTGPKLFEVWLLIALGWGAILPGLFILFGPWAKWFWSWNPLIRTVGIVIPLGFAGGFVSTTIDRRVESTAPPAFVFDEALYKMDPEGRRSSPPVRPDPSIDAAAKAIPEPRPRVPEPPAPAVEILHDSLILLDVGNCHKRSCADFRRPSPTAGSDRIRLCEGTAYQGPNILQGGMMSDAKAYRVSYRKAGPNDDCGEMTKAEGPYQPK